MNRRSFLKVLGAVGAGLALRAVPVVGETFSELVPERIFAAAPPPTETFWDFRYNLENGDLIGIAKLPAHWMAQLDVPDSNLHPEDILAALRYLDDREQPRPGDTIIFPRLANITPRTWSLG